MPPPTWKSDSEPGPGFVCQTLVFKDDYDGPVTATLIRNETLVKQGKPAILYLHGFSDYFFQKHVAHRFNKKGHNFYALDLRKYGRSLNRARHPNICLTIEEYFPEITKALEIIADEGQPSVVLMAHSTGALPGALYAKEGCRRAFISRIILNSPFLAFPQGRVFAWIGAGFGKYCPFRDTDNLEFKPLEGFRVFYGWIRAVVAAQDRIRAGLDLQQPVLVMHSDKSANDKKWSDRLHRADLVLKVRDIKELGPRLGKQVVMAPITDGKHDLTLSQQGPLEVCLKTMVEWAGKP